MRPAKRILKWLALRLLGRRRFARLRYAIEKRFVENASYSRAYYESLEGFVGDSCAQLGSALMDEFRPESAVDVGCGSGGFSVALLEAGCRTISAFDYSSDAAEMARSKGLPRVERIDLTRTKVIPAKGDICLCIEVAEHIPECHAPRLCGLLSEVAPILIFTAAPPGQGGHHHVNEKPRDYWIDLMHRINMEYDGESVARIRRIIDGNVAKMYASNLMVFRRLGTQGPAAEAPAR